jgi:hypothetical protein
MEWERRKGGAHLHRRQQLRLPHGKWLGGECGRAGCGGWGNEEELRNKGGRWSGVREREVHTCTAANSSGRPGEGVCAGAGVCPGAKLKRVHGCMRLFGWVGWRLKERGRKGHGTHLHRRQQLRLPRPLPVASHPPNIRLEILVLFFIACHKNTRNVDLTGDGR